jgi:hypothetical protein
MVTELGLITVSGVGSASGTDLVTNLGLETSPGAGSGTSPGTSPGTGLGLAEVPGTGFVPAKENVKKRQSAST